MDAFDRLNLARGTLFQTVNTCAASAAFLLIERSALNELLADPLAADHLLLLEAGLRAQGDAALDAVTALLVAADTGMKAVLAGANSKLERRDATDQLDNACDAYTQLLDAAAR